MKIALTLLMVMVCCAALLGQASPAGSKGDPTGQGTSMRNGPQGVGAAGIPPGNANETGFNLSLSNKLAEKLSTMLPQGADVHAASKGFTDLKDFVASVRAANNLGIPYPELKHSMQDGSAGALRDAIHKLKPNVDAKVEVKKAQEQAKQDIKDSKG